MESIQPKEPQWFERHAGSANLRLIVAFLSMILGVVLQHYVLILIGLGFALLAWFTTPRYYSIYEDRMVIFYGQPRSRHVRFDHIEWVDALPLPLGNRLIIRLRTSGRLMIQPTNSIEFRRRLQTAVETYQSNHGFQT